MTSSGIEHDLKVTPYVTKVMYGKNTYEFYFSSINGMKRFERDLEQNRIYINESLTRRFHMKFYVANAFCDVQLYKKIESRGFRIIINGSVVKWLGELEYNGKELIMSD